LPPKINSFTPLSGSSGTKVIIRGENFSLSKTRNIVKFGNWVAYVDYCSKDEIHVRVPEVLISTKVKITVEIGGEKISTNELFDIQFP
jgi:hypothetical protein